MQTDLASGTVFTESSIAIGTEELSPTEGLANGIISIDNTDKSITSC
jgi:hypothetical protein